MVRSDEVKGNNLVLLGRWCCMLIRKGRGSNFKLLNMWWKRGVLGEVVDRCQGGGRIYVESMKGGGSRREFV